ncbi:MAG TPA: peptide-methionine (S)-S-oxide reductase MsrA [Gammaproteobacteria bacterium]
MQTTGGDMTNGSHYQIATFAGGCFWCVESDFDKLPGIIDTISGFTGGHVENPSYEQVSEGGTGHAEAVQITYDPAKISYEQLLDYFWHSIDPTTANAQFCDHGSQYRSAIFYHNEEQHRLAEQSRSMLEKTKPFKEPIVTEIIAGTKFYPAEEYHQNFHQKSSLKYKFYRIRCGRDDRLEELWGNNDSYR